VGKNTTSTPVPARSPAKRWAVRRQERALELRIWRTLYNAHALARKQFPDVDWVNFLAILDVIETARGESKPVDVSYLAYEMGWPRTSALRRLRRYADAGYLMLSREGRHTYVNETPLAQRRARRLINAVLKGVDRDRPTEMDTF
jgi:hypothetical protein